MSIDIMTMLTDLQSAIGKNLIPNESGSIVIPYMDGIQVHLELSDDGETAIIAVEIGVLDEGLRAKDFMRNALRQNGMSPPYFGRLCLSEVNNSICLYASSPINQLNPQQVAAFLPQFAEMARTWKDALAAGNPPRLVHHH